MFRFLNDGVTALALSGIFGLTDCSSFLFLPFCQSVEGSQRPKIGRKRAKTRKIEDAKPDISRSDS